MLVVSYHQPPTINIESIEDVSLIPYLRPVFPETVFHVTCSSGYLGVLAEEMEMKKEDNDGHIRPVTVEELDQFPESGRVGPLSISDIHRCVSYAMERVHFPRSVRVSFFGHWLVLILSMHKCQKFL